MSRYGLHDLRRYQMARRPPKQPTWLVVASMVLAVGAAALFAHQALRACLTPPDVAALMSK